MRSAGSFGLYDLAAFKHGHWPTLISCKVHGKIPRAVMREIWRMAISVDAIAVLAWRVKPGQIGWVLADGYGEEWNPDDSPDGRPVSALRDLWGSAD